MATIKLTKNELRAQQAKLAQLRKYLPTLQLKKAMLQAEVSEARNELAEFQKKFEQEKNFVAAYSSLLVEKSSVDIQTVAKIKHINKHYENVAGVELPYYEGVEFEEISYSLFETPPWVDGAIVGLKKMAESYARVEIAREKKEALERELREVSIRVNLFEKVMIPRAVENIKKVKVFLGDQQLAAVCQAKVAKAKIVDRKAEVASCE